MTGYARVEQYADIIEFREYDKKVYPQRRRIKSRVQKKRDKERRNVWVEKHPFAISRAKNQFFKLVSENLYRNGPPTLITLTYHEQHVSIVEGYKSILTFKRNIKSAYGINLIYIAVPERQKSGRLHFHLLSWGLNGEIVKNERRTRNLQRLFGKGFLDVLVARDSSPKLATYLTKYFTKSYEAKETFGRRAYTVSRNANRPRIQGSNSLASYRDMLIPEDASLTESTVYDTLYLGQCHLTKYKINNYDN